MKRASSLGVACVLALVGCSEEGAPIVLGETAKKVSAPSDPTMPDLSACGAGPTDSAITVINDLGQIAGYEVTNTDAACPSSPAECGAWWAQIVPVGDAFDESDSDNQIVSFATRPAGDLCDTHVAESVFGRVELLRDEEVTNGTIHVIDLCLVDEHGHVATGAVELFAARGRGDAERPPCE